MLSPRTKTGEPTKTKNSATRIATKNTYLVSSKMFVPKTSNRPPAINFSLRRFGIRRYFFVVFLTALAVAEGFLATTFFTVAFLTEVFFTALAAEDFAEVAALAVPILVTPALAVIFLLKADFKRAALFLWKMPHLTALSINDTALGRVSGVTFLVAALIK